MPKMNCETMNHGQSTPRCSTGLTTPIKPKLTAVQSSGINSPPQAIGLGIAGSVGSSTP